MKPHPSVKGPLYKVELGAGEHRLVFIPGLSGTTRYWEGRITPLLQTHRVTLVDPLGFGRSPKPRTIYNINRHLAALAGALDDSAPVTLVGHSFGAILALAFAVRYPEKVKRLVLLSLPVFHSRSEAIRHFRELPGVERWFMGNPLTTALLCVLTRRVFGRMLPRIKSDLPPEVAADLLLHTWNSFTSTLWEVIYKHDVFGDASRLPSTMAVNLLHGDADVTAPLENVEELAARYPNWKLTELKGVDHHPLLREPEKSIAFIRKACRENGGATHG